MSLKQYPAGADLADFRKAVRDRRKSMDRRELSSLGGNVCARFLSLARDLRWAGLKVSLYRPLSDELPIGAVESELHRLGAQLYYPRMIQDGASERIIMLRVLDPHGPVWHVGPYGIQEPGPMAEECVPESLDLILIPGLAFGSSGERIGLGKGHYDRFLAQAPSALRITLALDLQLFESIPQNSWDQPVDWVVSEKREFRTARAAAWLAGKGRAAS